MTDLGFLKDNSKKVNRIQANRDMEPSALSITEKGDFLFSAHPLPQVDEIIGYLSQHFLWRPETFLLYYRKCTAPLVNRNN